MSVFASLRVGCLATDRQTTGEGSRSARPAKGSGHKVLAEWMLLTSASKSVHAEHLACCYHWRWRIESDFTLLESHGQQRDQWQQETGLAIARRLLVASMACVVIWQLQADETPQATERKAILIRFSRRPMKRNRPHTAPALLAGLWVMAQGRFFISPASPSPEHESRF